MSDDRYTDADEPEMSLTADGGRLRSVGRVKWVMSLK